MEAARPHAAGGEGVADGHEADEVLEAFIGDCVDFHALLAAEEADALPGLTRLTRSHQ